MSHLSKKSSVISFLLFDFNKIGKNAHHFEDNAVLRIKKLSSRFVRTIDYTQRTGLFSKEAPSTIDWNISACWDYDNSIVCVFLAFVTALLCKFTHARAGNTKNAFTTGLPNEQCFTSRTKKTLT